MFPFYDFRCVSQTDQGLQIIAMQVSFSGNGWTKYYNLSHSHLPTLLKQ